MLDAIGDQARYIGPIGAGSVAKLVHNCAGLCHPDRARRGLHDGRQGRASSRWRCGKRCGRAPSAAAAPSTASIDQFLPNKYDPPAFALRLAHKDVSLATQLGARARRAHALADLTLAEMTEALNRGWQGRDSRSPMLLQHERAGVTVAVEPPRLAAALERDPPYKGDPKRS